MISKSVRRTVATRNLFNPRLYRPTSYREKHTATHKQRTLHAINDKQQQTCTYLNSPVIDEDE